MKFENYSIVKSPTGISIKPHNGDSDVELCLCVEGDNLVATLYSATHNPIGEHWSEWTHDWCVPVGEIQHPISGGN